MKSVWKFTNGRELNKSEFINYIERKVFRTIRKFNMLPDNKIFELKRSRNLNTLILKQILSQKFVVNNEAKQNISTDNLSQVAEDIFENVMNGRFDGPLPNDKPLYYVSDKEIELYCKLKNIKGEKRNQNKKIQNLFAKFLKKNQDLEINIIKALSQIKNIG